jgi:epoxide hydrolase-like predicted phosphatase
LLGLELRVQIYTFVAKFKACSKYFFMIAFQKSEIKNIIFDLGGVLLNINPLLSLLEFEKLSGIAKEHLIVRFESEQVFKKFETGNLNPSQFRSELCRIMNITVSDSEIDRIWNKLILDVPAHRVKLLQDLQKNYRVFLLSNTNSIHFDHYSSEFHEKYGMYLTELFEKLFLSHDIGIHKPDEGIYTYVLENVNLNASETLFIDDSLANVKAAALQGIHVIQITDSRDVVSFFDNGILQ